MRRRIRGWHRERRVAGIVWKRNRDKQETKIMIQRERMNDITRSFNPQAKTFPSIWSQRFESLEYTQTWSPLHPKIRLP